MEIKRINEFLLPYNIELICDSCQNVDPNKSRTQTDLPSKLRSSASMKSPKEAKPQEATPVKNKMIRKSKPCQRKQQLNENEKSLTKNAPATLVFSSPGTHRNNLKLIQSLGINPPNESLNLNTIENSLNRRRDIWRILEESMRTPLKIGEVEVERGYRSDVKTHAGRNHLTNSTTEELMFEFPEIPDDQKNGLAENTCNSRFNYEIALGNEFSRDTSPFHTPVKFIAETPISKFGKTPNSILSISPIDRGNLLMEGAKRNHSDFPMNLFYDSL